MQQWAWLKESISTGLAIDRDGLYVLAALPLGLLGALILRRPLWSWSAWLFVLTAALANQLASRLAVGLHQPSEIWGSARDLALTMAVPTFLVVIARVAPHLLSVSDVRRIWIPTRPRRESDAIVDAEFEEIR